MEGMEIPQALQIAVTCLGDGCGKKERFVADLILSR
jgi:hypothetical protein